MELFPEFSFKPKSSGSALIDLPENCETRPQTVCDATFLHLLGLAKLFRDLEPWSKIRENEIIGIREPGTDQLGIASILGRGHTIFALHYHIPPTGIRFWQSAMRKQSPELDAIAILACQFVDRDDTPERDLEKISDVGRKPSRKRRGVPVFRNCSGDEIPRDLYQSEAERLALVFDLVTLYYDECVPKKHKEFFPFGGTGDKDFRIPVLSLIPGGSPNYLADWRIQLEVFSESARQDA